TEMKEYGEQAWSTISHSGLLTKYSPTQLLRYVVLNMYVIISTRVVDGICLSTPPTTTIQTNRWDSRTIT
ncbi:hypothetical protein ABTG52_14240, partial [Acinetobacter baumannii]